MSMTSIKTAQQQEEYNEIRDGLNCYIRDHIIRSIYKVCMITTTDIKKNLNTSSIRYSDKLASELMKEMEQYYNIQAEEVHYTFGQTLKKCNEYKCTLKH